MEQTKQPSEILLNYLTQYIGKNPIFTLMISKLNLQNTDEDENIKKILKSLELIYIHQILILKYIFSNKANNYISTIIHKLFDENTIITLPKHNELNIDILTLIETGITLNTQLTTLIKFKHNNLNTQNENLKLLIQQITSNFNSTISELLNN